MVDTQKCLISPKCSTLVQVLEVPLNRQVQGPLSKTTKLKDYKRNLACSRKQVILGCTWVNFRPSHLGGKSSWPRLPKEGSRTFQKTWCPRHVGLSFLDGSRKCCSFSLFLRTPSVSYVVLLLSYSYKSKLRNLLACWFKVKLIF